ncbi:flagellar assembly protein FliW [Thiospirochaeta perfilievii]|uniref:Flagellar assembly factor FliW n=1 Tax=Thiospirochaeta perfilievii TaxID=252967 RepID=A0A5C1QFB7_9SPIO|nr:flagellar assembly protein FliW [Thiospirochaeta perfilievii]QEN05820.1 flagellar assembly protein FliW [Thiospirochaeta perfilievii]
MIIDSKAYGKISVDDKQIFYFEDGLLGFESIKKFALIDASQPPFMWLQSVDVTHLAFIVLDPKIFRDDYDPGLEKEDLEKINIFEENSDVKLVLSIITIPENQNDMTANLQGPVVLNKESLLGKQFISNNDKWGTRHHVMDELAGKRAATC